MCIRDRLEDSRTACQLVRLERPLLSEEEFERICAIDRVGFKLSLIHIYG